VPGVIDTCWDALSHGGRLVVNAVTLESERVVADWRDKVGGDLIRVAISQAAPLGGFTAFRPTLPVTQWTVLKP
jgi:precorrin-6Y C5,15-methyltransferase (decarboxylating)